MKSSFVNRSGQLVDTVYREGIDPLEDMDGKILMNVHAYCFCGDKFLIVYTDRRTSWTPAGGRIEPGETYEQAVVREVKEESNMKVLRQEVIGVLDVYQPGGPIRSVKSVCIVEPYGDFVSDPDTDGGVTEIKLIDVSDFKKYFDWDEVGDRIMQRAIELKEKML